MKPNYKEITIKQWEEIFKAGNDSFIMSDVKAVSFGAGVEVRYKINTYRHSDFFFFRREGFICGEKFSHVKATRKMSEYIDLGMSNQIPKELTAENGAKALLNGEFSENVMIYNDLEGVEFPRKVPVKWSTIKSIYSKIVKHYTQQP